MFDWHQLHGTSRDAPATVDPRRRMRICLAGFLALAALVFGRTVQLEWSYGPGFQADANRPLARRVSVPGVRGRILSSDGAVLACDRKIFALAVHYRYLQEPCNSTWLRLTARSRLTPAERRRAERVQAEETRLLDQRRQLAVRLRELCGIPALAWEGQVRQIQARVEKIADSANQRRQAEAQRRHQAAADTPEESLFARLGREMLDGLESSSGELRRITVAEELDYHVVAEDVPLPVVAEIEAHPETYRGVKIVERSRRTYPTGTRAAHVLGHLGPAETAAPELVGRAGLERQYESLLGGRPGVAVELTDHGGRILSTYRQREPGVGRDLVLTLDSRLQAAAESLLDQALQRRTLTATAPGSEAHGGAIVVLDVHSGAIRAAAAAPRFAPGLFGQGAQGGPRVRTTFPEGPATNLHAVPGAAQNVSDSFAALLADPAHPLFDRVAAMALPPGSVFKVVTAAALLESASVRADSPFDCRGYLDQPDQWRCAEYARHGRGHGEVTLADALAQSCNVYFFHHAREMGAASLVAWAERFGFGRPTGVDLPGEAAGTLPTSPTVAQRRDRPWRTADTLATSIGQGAVAATPLQVARVMAAVANGGQLVRPHLVAGLGLPDRSPGPQPEADAESADDLLPAVPAEPIAGLHAGTLSAIDEGLRRAVADRAGTAHATVYLESVAVAGQTGTAQVGGDRADHAWFAGYVPADHPRWALVVVIEQGGDGAAAAGPVARRLVEQMLLLGLIGGGRDPVYREP